MHHRTDHDSMGDVRVPADAYWGPQTQRAVENFPISGLRLQPAFIRAQGIIKRACALTNLELGALDKQVANAIVKASEEVLEGHLNAQFVVDVYQAGAGTSQNMNANEVIANRAIELLGGKKGDYSLVHPNDHVNRGQSTNDTIPTAIHVSALEAIHLDLIPALQQLHGSLSAKAKQFDPIIKAGRTHLQDAVPMRLGQEFSAWARSVELGVERLQQASVGLKEVALGGNAVGTGINTPKGYREKAVAHLNDVARLGFVPSKDPFESIQNRDAAVHASGALRTVATSLKKIADDVRLLVSGPRTGFNELALPAVQPGSSIMPGKVNPVLAEMLNQVCLQVMGCDVTIAQAGGSGQLQLNVMMPVLAWNLLHAITILSNGVRTFTERCVDGIKANEAVARHYAEATPQVVTALSPVLGYEKAAAVLKKAIETDKTIRQVVLEEKLLDEATLNAALDLRKLT